MASSACAASATNISHSAALRPASVAQRFSWAAHIFKARRSLLALRSNSAGQADRILEPLTLAVRRTPSAQREILWKYRLTVKISENRIEFKNSDYYV
ncbi:MAG: DUF1010 domain-containing protein [Paenacidovorax caeni]